MRRSEARKPRPHIASNTHVAREAVLTSPVPALEAFPENVRYALLTGVTGKAHLLSMAETAMSVAAAGGESTAANLALAAGLLLKAWHEDPLDGALAGHLLALNQRVPFLKKQHLRLLQGLHGTWPENPNFAYCRRLEERGDSQRLLDHLKERCRREPEALPWRWLLYSHARSLGRWSLAASFLDSDPVVSAFPPVRDRLRADLASLAGEFDRAASLYAQVRETLPPMGGERLAAALLRAGRREEAVRQFSRVVQEAPWDVTSLLRLHDAVRGLDQGSALPLALPGQLAVLLYSWNKADDLDATLASLFASQLPKGTSITILNNGATDHTASVLEAWSGRDTGLEMHTVSLPVNVGAPAARNWLMSLEQAQRADYLCYLDDDLTLPRDWVGRLAQARESYPEAGVWGCKVLDDASPWLLQLADLHLLPPRDNERFNINIHEGQCDFGQMDHLRPCSSVTGCCHLFARERLLATGPFDLIFSPSQCDDLHRDLRMVLGGEYAVCQGHLAIRHKKRTGRAALKKNRDSFTARWNSAKLRDCFSPEQVAGMIASMRVVLENDLASKLDRLRGAGVLR